MDYQIPSPTAEVLAWQRAAMAQAQRVDVLNNEPGLPGVEKFSTIQDILDYNK